MPSSRISATSSRPAMVMVAGDIAVVAAKDLSGQVAEGVPNRRPAPVLPGRALDLVGRGRRAPQKTVGKFVAIVAVSPIFVTAPDDARAGRGVIGPAEDPRGINRVSAWQALASFRSSARRRRGASRAIRQDRASPRQDRGPDSDIQRSPSHDVTATSTRKGVPARGGASPSADQGISASAVMRGWSAPK